MLALLIDLTLANVVHDWANGEDEPKVTVTVRGKTCVNANGILWMYPIDATDDSKGTVLVYHAEGAGTYVTEPMIVIKSMIERAQEERVSV